MKLMKKLMVVLVAILMVMSLTGKVMADEVDPPAGDDSGNTTAAEKVTITVNRDSTYAGEATEAGNAYTWYKIFSAVPAEGFSSSNASGYAEDGTANVATGTGKVSYYATAAVGQKLQDAGNLWFDATAIPGSATGEYVVTWKDGVATDAATLQAAAAWLIANSAYEATGSMDFADGKWTASVDKGYYVIDGINGNNLIAATTDININEKNAYPPLEKTQADEDNNVQTDQNKSVAVGDVLNYVVKVTVPKTAAEGETIEVYDAPSKGLTYNAESMTVTPSTNVADKTLKTGDAWRKVITVTADNKGTEYVFAFTMTVNADALTDGDKMNPAGLVYNDYDSIPDKVYFETYYTGIEKVDGSDATKKLANVEFTLKEGTAEFKVTKTDDGYYIPDANGSSTVVTDSNGKIIIRGLDGDKTYTLTETKNPNGGYNLLTTPKTLNLVKDEIVDGEASYDPTTQFDQVENNQGTVLPSTGGIGTTIFHVAGAALVLGAGIILVSKKRVNG